MIRRIILLILSAVMCLSLAACNDSESKSSSKKSSKSRKGAASYEQAVDDLYTAMNNNDVKLFMKVMYPSLIKKDLEKAMGEEAFELMVATEMAEIKRQEAHSSNDEVTFSYTVSKTEKFDKDLMDSFKNEGIERKWGRSYASDPDNSDRKELLDQLDVTDGYIVYVDVTITDGNETRYDDGKWKVAEINGEWIIVDN